MPSTRPLSAVLLALSLATAGATPALAATSHHHPGGGGAWPSFPQDDQGDQGDQGAGDPAPVVTDPAVSVPSVTVPATPVTPAIPVTGQPSEPDPQGEEAFPTVTTSMVAGTQARLRTDGKAAVPRGAPKQVRTLVRHANEIVGKPYKWGGGHAKLVDKGYDCSGTVSYALIRTGLLGSPLVSGSLARYGAAGAGRWITIYGNAGHVYMEVAGLRLDTSAVGDPNGGDGPRWRPVIGKRPGFHVRHVVGL